MIKMNKLVRTAYSEARCWCSPRLLDLSTPNKLLIGKVLELDFQVGNIRRFYQQAHGGECRTSTIQRPQIGRTKLGKNFISPFNAGALAMPIHRQSTTATNTMTTTTTTTVPQAKEPRIHSIFEPQTCTWQYVIADPATRTAVIIDPVLDYDNTTRTISTTAADSLLDLIRSEGYTVSHVLETHAHADHLTAAFYLRRRLAALQEGTGPAPAVGIGRRIGQVQSLFGKRYGVAADEYDGAFDLLLDDDQVFWVGQLPGQVMHLPGHTPDHVGYRIGGEL